MMPDKPLSEDRAQMVEKAVYMAARFLCSCGASHLIAHSVASAVVDSTLPGSTIDEMKYQILYRVATL